MVSAYSMASPRGWLMVAVAVIPAIFLMYKVYKSDKLERESDKLLLKLAIAGILSTLLAIVEEELGCGVLQNIIDENTVLYQLIMYFVIVGVAEESSKFIFLRKRTWNNPEFNCRYDGIVYAVFVSLGFALFENIFYVLDYGFATAIVRALTAIPGHAAFGVFMGAFYGLAKKYSISGDEAKSKKFRRLAVFVPVLFHGGYDFIATMESSIGFGYFLLYVVFMFAAALRLLRMTAKNDYYFVMPRFREPSESDTEN